MQLKNILKKNFIVIPCNNKKPLLKDWSNIQEQDSDEIYEYFRSGKANQIGIRTDDVFVVDIDYDEVKKVDGYESLKQLKRLFQIILMRLYKLKLQEVELIFYFLKNQMR